MQFNVLAEGRQEAAHNKKLFAPPVLPQSTLIKTPQFLLYSLHFSKNQKHQAIFLLFYLNQSSAWTLGKCKHTDNMKRADSRSQAPPDLLQLSRSKGLSPKPRFTPELHWFICVGIRLQVNWKVECGYWRVNYILTTESLRKGKTQNPSLLHSPVSAQSTEFFLGSCELECLDFRCAGLSSTHRSRKLLGLVSRLKKKCFQYKGRSQNVKTPQLSSALVLFGVGSHR